jgi:dTDP-glucose pyrophosphorylase
MKGLIPAAGEGKRLRPYTDVVPKELLLIGDKPVIGHVIEAFGIAEVRDITVVISRGKYAIIDYLGSGKRFGVNITYVVQDERTGLAKAVEAGKHAIGNNSFAVVNGDNFFHPKAFLRDLINYHLDEGADATIGAFEAEDVTRHGVIRTERNRVVDIVEKPKLVKETNTLCDAGLHVFEPVIYEAIEKTKPGLDNEYQLTDSIKVLIEDGKKIIFKKIEGVHIDVGTMEDFKMANYYLMSREGTK